MTVTTVSDVLEQLQGARLPDGAVVAVAVDEPPSRVTIRNGSGYEHWMVRVYQDDTDLVVFAAHGNGVVLSEARLRYVPPQHVGDLVVGLCWSASEEVES